MFPVAIISPRWLRLSSFVTPGMDLVDDIGKVVMKSGFQEIYLEQLGAQSIAGPSGTPVRLAAVEEVANAVDRVLEERGDEENDDTRGGRHKGNCVQRGN